MLNKYVSIHLNSCISIFSLASYYKWHFLHQFTNMSGNSDGVIFDDQAKLPCSWQAKMDMFMLSRYSHNATKIQIFEFPIFDFWRQNSNISKNFHHVFEKFRNFNFIIFSRKIGFFTFYNFFWALWSSKNVNFIIFFR